MKKKMTAFTLGISFVTITAIIISKKEKLPKKKIFSPQMFNRELDISK
jgi:hypothetical protein